MQKNSVITTEIIKNIAYHVFPTSQCESRKTRTSPVDSLAPSSLARIRPERFGKRINFTFFGKRVLK